MGEQEEVDRSAANGSALRDKLARKYRELCRSESPQQLSEFVLRNKGLDAATIAALVRVDLEERIQRGESVSVEHYFRHFPELSRDAELAAELLAAEYEVLAARYPNLPVAEPHYFPPNVLEPTATRLLRRATAGESRAWELLVRIYGPVVRYWCRQAGLKHEAIEDVFSETFLAVVRNLPKFDRQEGKAKFRAWLKTVTLSKLNSYFRQQRKQPPALGGSTAMLRLGELEASENCIAGSGEIASEDGDAALAHAEEAFLAQRMLQMVRNEFRDKTWKAFYRTAIEGCTSQQAAAELGMSALAVRKAKSRVLQRLKEEMNGVENQD